MASSHIVLCLSPTWRVLGNGVVGARRRGLDFCVMGEVSLGGRVGGGFPKLRCRARQRGIKAWARLKAVEAPAAESGQRLGSFIEIPVTCYQLLGIPVKAEKDEVVKAAMELRSSETDDGYTADVIASRQNLLVDVRDKILFEPEYSGNLKQMVPPKSHLRIPWSWLPGALSLLQEVGEEKLVLQIGKAALQLPDSYLYAHDLLLSMALAECSIAKTSLEKNRVSEGFEALARAQYLLKSKSSLGKMPLLSQIEESLEELAPACTLEHLGASHGPDNAERRRGAISALRELLRQGLDVEACCRVQDWPCFLSQAMKKLMAAEIVDLISWDALAIARKNKKSLESQSQRVVIDFDCFYKAMAAHIAIGFSTRQTESVNRAKTICECLVASDGVDLKFEEAFCSLLLGQGNESTVVELLRQLEGNGSASKKFESIIPNNEIKEKENTKELLETWLKDTVLCVFADTRDCSPSLANFFGGPKRIFRGSKQILGTSKSPSSSIHRSMSIGLSSELGAPGDQHHYRNSTHLGEAVKQLAPADLQSQLPLSKTSGCGPSVQLRRNLGLDQTKAWQSWKETGDWLGKVSCVLLVGSLAFLSIKVVSVQLGSFKTYHKWVSNQSKMSSSSLWTVKPSPSKRGISGDGSVFGALDKLLAVFRQNLNCRTRAAALHDSWPPDDLSPSTTEATASTTLLHRRQMPLEEAEALVKQWQEIKAEVLGPNHQVHYLTEILEGAMLSKWQDLANSAKARSCFWRFVLLQLSILRADIRRDEDGRELAEIEALLEEAAELVDDSQPKKPSYYSKYKVHYVLRRQGDGSWRFCRGGIQNHV